MSGDRRPVGFSGYDRPALTLSAVKNIQAGIMKVASVREAGIPASSSRIFPVLLDAPESEKTARKSAKKMA